MAISKAEELIGDYEGNTWLIGRHVGQLDILRAMIMDKRQQTRSGIKWDKGNDLR